jgi:hypothetical protein
MNEAHLPEPVHEKTHARTSSSHHFCQGLLTDLGNHGLGHAFLAKMGEQKKDTVPGLFSLEL